MLKRLSGLFLQSKFYLIVILVLGTLSWSLTMVKSGLIYSFGMGFWGANGHDAIWHLALISGFSKGVFSVPVFAGYPLQNYHIGFDLLMAGLHVTTLISPVTLYFQIIPPILAFLIGLLTYKFVYDWTKSRFSAALSTFFVYFGGSFGWVVTLFRRQGLGGESMFWSQQGVSTLINPPFALSLVFILLGLIYLIKYLRASRLINLILSGLCFGILIEIKIYAGLLVLGGLTLAVFWEVLIKHSVKNILKVFLLSLITSLIIFFSLNRSSGNLIIFQPFWFLETMMGLSDRLGWMKFYSAMTTYKQGHVYIKEIAAYLVAFAIFIYGNLGTRAVFIKDLFKKPDYLKVLMLGIIGAGIVIPMLFLQKGTPWNTIQFFYYSLFFSAILAGVALEKITKKPLIVMLLVVLTIPTAIGTLYYVYIPNRPPAMISNEELSALSFLSKQPDGVVLTYPYDPIKAKEAEINLPRPLFLYDSTAYVSAFGGKTTFLEDEVNLDITGYKWTERLATVQNWYKEPNEAKAREFLKENNIKYIYWIKGQRAYLGEGQLDLVRLFENKEVDIWKVGD